MRWMFAGSRDPVMKIILEPTVSVDGDCRIDTVLVAFQTDIHQHKDWTMLASESDSLIRCTGNAAHRYPHIFDLSLEHVSDKKLVFHDQDTVDQVGHWTES